MSDRPLQHFIMGLPDAGKTTFLAALWHVVESKEIDTALVLDSFHGDQGYLHAIRAAWADCNEIERTKVAHEQYVSMRLREHDNTAVTELVIPDLSGESFRGQWRDRQMDSKYADLLTQSSGGLLFVHPKRVHTETLIPEVNQMLARMTKGDKKVEADTTEESPQQPTVTRRADKHYATGSMGRQESTNAGATCRLNPVCTRNVRPTDESRCGDFRLGLRQR